MIDLNHGSGFLYGSSAARPPIAEAVSAAIDTALSARHRAEQAAEEASASEALAEARRIENKLTTLFAEANAAFLNEHYQNAEALCTQVLLDDPSNKDALTLRDVAREARHASVEARNRRDYREQWQRTFEELDERGMLEDVGVDKRSSKRDPDVVAFRPTNGFRTLFLDPCLTDGNPSLADPVDRLSGDQVFENDEPVDPPFLEELVDVVWHLFLLNYRFWRNGRKATASISTR